MGKYTGKTYTQNEYEKLNINAATGKPFGQASDEAVDTQVKDWQDKGANVVGAEQPEDIRSLGSKIIDWADTPDGLAVLGGLGLAGAATYLGLKARKKSQAEAAAAPKMEPSYDFETTAREVSNRPGLPQPSTSVPQATTAGPMPTAPSGVPSTQQQFSVQDKPVDYSLNPKPGYSQTTLNQPTGAPNPLPAGPAAPPAGTEIKPIDPYQQAKIDKLAAETALINQRAAQDADAHAKEQQRRDDAHKARLAKDADKVVASQQKSQGKPVNGLSNDANALVANAAEGKMKADLAEATGGKPKNPLPIGGTGAPMPPNAMPVGEPPVSSAPAPAVTAAPVVPAPEKVAAAQQATPEFQQKLGTPTAETGSGMPAYHGEGGDKAKMRKEFTSIKDVPKGYVFVPGGQNMDIVRNAVGQDTYTKTLKESGGFPATTEQAYQQSRDINKAAGRLPREQAKAAGESLGETVKGITKAVAKSKSVRVAGVTGALVLATDLVSAAEEGVSAAKKGDTQMARGYATDIAGALTGPFGFLASQTLGTSPEDLRILRAAEQGRKVGGGRGIAPPTAYQR